MTETVWLDDVVHRALEAGWKVAIELDDEYGWHIAIDGERVTDIGPEGLPWETLTYEIPRTIERDAGGRE